MSRRRRRDPRGGARPPAASEAGRGQPDSKRAPASAAAGGAAGATAAGGPATPSAASAVRGGERRSARRLALAGLGLAALAAAAVWIAERGTAPVRREAGLDVLLVTIDTLRADALGCYGGRAETPVIDRLAAAGVRFEHAHAHNVITLPSHANILSGVHPLVHGVRDNSGFRFPADVETLATRLRGRGYRTGAFVSAFPLHSRFGLARGFDVYDDAFLSGAGSALAEQERPATETVAAARRFWEAQAGAPSFVWVHLYEPHFPYAPPAPFAGRYASDPYAGEVAASDAALAPLLEPLLAAGAAGRTLVVLTSDHGESLGEHGEKTHGIFAYEGPLRVPLVLYAPRLLAPRLVRDGVRHVDIAPTVLDALGEPLPDGLDGRSLLALAAGRREPAAPAYFEALSGMMNRRWAPLYGVVSEGTKYIELPLPELYDLESDPREQRNLVATRPEQVEALRALLGRLRAGERPLARERESAEVRERLQALGYLAAGGEAPGERRYTEGDDPKRLIAIDAELQQVRERFQQGDLAGALALCAEVVRERPDMPQPLVQLASLRRLSGDLPGAIDGATRALRLNPEDADTAALLGGYLNDAGRPGEAAALLAPFAALADPLPEVLLVRGSALARDGRPAEALAHFERVRELMPTNATALLNVGTVHLMEGRAGAARAAFEAALALDPALAEAHNSLGVLAAREGRSEQAIAHWRRAVELEPREYDTLFNLGSLLIRLGRGAEARPYFERFAREAPPALYGRDLERVRSWLRETPAR